MNKIELLESIRERLNILTILVEDDSLRIELHQLESDVIQIMEELNQEN